MSENIKKIENTENIAAVEGTKTNATPQYTVGYILGQISEIQKQTEYLYQCLTELSAIRSDGPEDTAPAAKATALADVVRCRETTNQQMLKFYEKVYDGLISSKTGILDTAMRRIVYEDDTVEERTQMMKNMYDIFMKQN